MQLHLGRLRPASTPDCERAPEADKMRKGGHAWVSEQTTGEQCLRICVLRHGRGSDKAETIVIASTFLVFGTQGLTFGLHRRSREVEAARQPGRHRQDPRRQREQKAAAQGMLMHLGYSSSKTFARHRVRGWAAVAPPVEPLRARSTMGVSLGHQACDVRLCRHVAIPDSRVSVKLADREATYEK